MNIAVLLRAVPDPVEELEVEGNDLDRDYLGYVLNEFDDHALEEGLLLKEEVGGTVTVVAIGTADEVDQMLYTALAKGADSAVKLGESLDPVDAHAQAAMFAAALREGGHDLILCGVQASDELDGQVAVLVAAALGLPHVSVVVAAHPSDGGLRVTKEFWAGITGDYQVRLPAVLGIQAARQAPRYVAVSRIRQAQQEAGMDERDTDHAGPGSGVSVTAMRMAESGTGAEMIDSDAEAAAERILEIIRAAGVT